MTITLHGSVAEIIQSQTTIGGYQSPEDLVHDALNALIQQKVDGGIAKGLEDMRDGHFMELHTGNINEVLSKPLSQW